MKEPASKKPPRPRGKRSPARAPRSDGRRPERARGSAAGLPPAALVEQSRDGILAVDRELRFTLWNEALERLTGVERAQVLGRPVFEVFPFLRESGEDNYFADALAGHSGAARHRNFTLPKDGRRVVLDAFYAPLLDASGAVAGAWSIVREVSGSVPGEAARHRFAFLAELSRVLAGSLEARETLHSLASLLVPALADYCIIDLLEEDGGIARVESLHRDPARQGLVDMLRLRYPPDPERQRGIARALRSGGATLYPEISVDQLRGAARSPEHLQLMIELEPVSAWWCR